MKSICTAVLAASLLASPFAFAHDDDAKAKAPVASETLGKVKFANS